MDSRGIQLKSCRRGVGVVLVLVGVATSGLADDTKNPGDRNEQRVARSAEAADLKAAEARVIALAAQRAALASELRELMAYGRGAADSPNRTNHLAARELAELRELDAIPFLVQYVAWEITPFRSAGSGTYPEYPHVHALALYGRQAVPYIAHYVAHVPKLTGNELDLYCFVLLAEYGYDDAGRQKACDALEARVVARPENVARLRSHLKAYQPPKPGR